MTLDMKPNIAPDWIKRPLDEQKPNGALEYFKGKLANCEGGEQIFKVSLLSWSDITDLFIIPQDPEYRLHHKRLVTRIRNYAPERRTRYNQNKIKVYARKEHCYFFNVHDTGEIGTWIRGIVLFPHIKYEHTYHVKSIDYGFISLRCQHHMRPADPMFKIHGRWSLECALTGLDFLAKRSRHDRVPISRNMDAWIRDRLVADTEKQATFYALFTSDLSKNCTKPEVTLFYEREIPPKPYELLKPRTSKVYECLNSHLLLESEGSENSTFREPEVNSLLWKLSVQLTIEPSKSIVFTPNESAMALSSKPKQTDLKTSRAQKIQANSNH